MPEKPPATTSLYEAAEFAELPGWSEADHAASLRGFLTGCGRGAAHRALHEACESARLLPPAESDAARRFFEGRFAAWRIVNEDGSRDGLVTGYYEPILDGSRTRTGAFVHPVFGVPADFIRGSPYLSREEIARRGTKLDAPIVAWVADPVELFFLQVQGSGQLQLHGGERLRLGFAEHNGHPYRSLGRHLVERGELTLEQASMQGIKAWAAANPAKLEGALNANPRYVFFRESPPGPGPFGALGAPLSAGYSIAVDRRFVPLGSPVYLATTYPLSERPLQRLMLAQDTGGAILGAVRADFYWGTGEEAGTMAGRMRQRGEMWLLWPRGETPALR